MQSTFKQERPAARGQAVGPSCSPRPKQGLPFRFIGESNESEASVDNIPCKCLLDSGSMITSIAEWFCREHGLDKKIQDLDHFRVDGSNGLPVPYIGYVELEISVPEENTGMVQEHLLPVLVVKDTPYNRQIPLIAGTNFIALCRKNCMKKFGVNFLQRSSVCMPWQLAFQHCTQRERFCSKDGYIDTVHAHREIEIPANSCLTLRAKTKCPPLGDTYEIVMEPVKCGHITVAPQVVSITHKNCHIPVILRNTSNRTVKIPKGTALCQVQQAVWIGNPTQCAMNVGSAEELQFDIDHSMMTDKQGEQLECLLHRWKHIFASDNSQLGHTTTVVHKIKLTDDIPFKERHRRIPPALYDEVKQHLEAMVSAGVIRESHSPYASPIVIVRKKDGSIRLCIDYRHLNSKTIKDAYPLPRIEETLDILNGAKYFSCLDLLSGYWQVEVAEEDKQKTAFTVGPLGFWESNRLPFGLVNAPATFQRLMEKCLAGIHLKDCLIYLDDIVVFSKTFSEHLERLEAVFQRLADHGLKLKPSKCHLFRQQCCYLGHIVSAEGIQTDPEKTKALQNWPIPTSPKELKTFLGFAGYYRKFVPAFAMIAKPLYKLAVTDAPRTKKGKGKKSSEVPVWDWTPECQHAFEALVHCLTTAPILAYADYQKPFELHTDASGDALGAVLYQKQEEKMRVIAYASRTLTPTERNYSVHKREFLALKWAVTEKFHDYLYGSSFKVVTDNNPVTYVLTSAKLDAAGHRWLAALACYNFTLEYKAGKAHMDADGLSRIPQRNSVDQRILNCLIQRCHVPYFETLAMTIDAFPTENPPIPPGQRTLPHITMEEWQGYQKGDEDIGRVIELLHLKNRPSKGVLAKESQQVRQILKEWDKLCWKQGVLHRKRLVDDKVVHQLVLPKQFRSLVLTGLHDDVGHLGRDRTLELVRDRFFWPYMAADVETKVRNCDRCIRRKPRPDAYRPVPLVSISTSQPMELVCIDFLSLEQSKGGYENILVVTDHFTRYAQAFPTKNQTAQTTARVLYDNFFVHYGFPARLHSDQGRNFESSIIRELCKLGDITKSRTTPYHPMGNGMTERFNRTLLNMMGTLTEERKTRWKEYVPSLVHAYNATKHDSTGYSPFFLMFGRHPRLPIDVYLGLEANDEGESDYGAYVQKMKEKMSFAFGLATKEARDASGRQKTAYDSKARESVLSKGDRVLVKNLGIRGKQKLANYWEEQPYVIVDQPNIDIPVYQVKLESGKGRLRTLHRNLLLPVLSLPCPMEVPKPKRRDQVNNKRVRKVKLSRDTTEIESSAGSSSDEETEHYVLRSTLRAEAPSFVPRQPDQVGNLDFGNDAVPVRETQIPSEQAEIQEEPNILVAMPEDQAENEDNAAKEDSQDVLGPESMSPERVAEVDFASDHMSLDPSSAPVELLQDDTHSGHSLFEESDLSNVSGDVIILEDIPLEEVERNDGGNPEVELLDPPVVGPEAKSSQSDDEHEGSNVRRSTRERRPPKWLDKNWITHAQIWLV